MTKKEKNAKQMKKALTSTGDAKLKAPTSITESDGIISIEYHSLTISGTGKELLSLRGIGTELCWRLLKAYPGIKGRTMTVADLPTSSRGEGSGSGSRPLSENTIARLAMEDILFPIVGENKESTIFKKAKAFYSLALIIIKSIRAISPETKDEDLFYLVGVQAYKEDKIFTREVSQAIAREIISRN